MKRFVFILVVILVPLLTLAQASGGQIKRPTKKQSSGLSTNNRKQYNAVKKKQKTDQKEKRNDTNPIYNNSSNTNYNNSNVEFSSSGSKYEKAKQLRLEGKGYQAITLYKDIYETGDSPYRIWSLCQIGRLYYYGLGGVNTDFSKAFDFFKLASDKGSLPATYYVGLCYQYGRGVRKDESRASSYFIKSGYRIAPSLDF